MQPHQQRVLDEYEALNEKTQALHKFLSMELYTKLDETEQWLLSAQHAAMSLYAGILQQRIAKF